MIVDMAYTNIFTQAGLFTETSSRFTSLSSVSGASWFSTQLFYSPEFYANVTQSTPDELGDFVKQWMDSYLTTTVNIVQNPQCNFTSDSTEPLPNLETGDAPGINPIVALENLCNGMIDIQGEWATLVYDMVQNASKAYGDPNFVDRKATPENRNVAMSNTDLYIQTTLAPNSRIRSTGEGVFLGPPLDADQGRLLQREGINKTVYRVPIGVQYSVSTDSAYYYASLPEGKLDLSTKIVELSEKLQYTKGFKEFGLFPDPESTVLMDLGANKPIVETGTLETPFGSDPTVIQVAAASSAAVGEYSPLVPSLFSQRFSDFRYPLNIVEKQVYDKIIDKIYETSVVDGFSVCSQWPTKECGDQDGRFVDGYWSDQGSFALNVAQYQNNVQGSSIDDTLKFVLTNNNVYTYGPEGAVLCYFDTYFNQNITPGEYLWPDDLPGYFNTPIMSPQIFGDYMDLDTLANITIPIEGLNVTTARISTKTIENKNLNVLPGQPVELLVISLNSFIPTVILGEVEIEEYTQPLVDLATSIASSKELVDRVRDFFGDTPAPTQPPNSPPDPPGPPPMPSSSSSKSSKKSKKKGKKSKKSVKKGKKGKEKGPYPASF